MKSSDKRLVRAYLSQQTDRIPFWFMRQAGRYLPEYKELRSKTKNFLEFCYTPSFACEATLQPIRRFGMDGAIIFSDILVVPHALGVEVRFEEGTGPILGAIREKKSLSKLNPGAAGEKLSPVYDALRLVRAALPKETALIGFVGAPWTLACYVVEGGTSKHFDAVKTLASSDREFFSRLIDMLAETATGHAISQIEAGAEAIQIFDSWAGILSDGPYRQWVMEPTRAMVSAIKKKYPEVPVIGFPRQSGSRFEIYAGETGVDAVSFDSSVPLAWVKDRLQPKAAVQGCLDPVALAENRPAMLAEAKNILSTLDKPFVFNLGHGILPHTPIENVQALCEFLKTAP